MSAEPAKDLPPGLKDAGSLALKKFLPILDSPQMKETHGFAGDDDLKNVTLGKPFESFMLPDEAIQKYAGGKVKESLVNTGTWYFPVESKGKIACLASVDKRADGTFVPDTLGMADLAKVWAGVTEAWPASKGNHPLLILVPTRQRFFFTVPEAAFPNMTPLSIQMAGAPVKFYQKLTRADEAFAALKSESSSPNPPQ